MKSVTTCRGCTSYANNCKPYCVDGLRRFYRSGVVLEGPALERNANGQVVEPGFHFFDALGIE